MSTIQLEVPEEVLVSLKETPETISRELKILAAIKLFELGKLSSGRAAQLADLSKVEFLMLLGQYSVSPFSLTPEELAHDIEWSKIQAVTSPNLIPTLVDLGQGEAEVLALGIENPSSLLIFDDQLARRVASLYKLKYTGTRRVVKGANHDSLN